MLNGDATGLRPIPGPFRDAVCGRLIDDEILIYVDLGRVVLYDLSTDSVVAELDCELENGIVYKLDVSPDRKTAAIAAGHFPIAYDRPARVDLIDLQSRTQESIALPGGLMYSVPCFSPDSKRAAVCANDGIKIINVSTAEVEHAIPIRREDNWGYMHLIYSPDGKLLVGSTTIGWAHVFSTTDYRKLREFRVEPDYAGDVRFSLDGRDLAVVGFENRIKLFDPMTGQQRPVEFQKTSTYHTSLAYSPDGQRMVTTSLNDTPKIWNAKTGG